MCSYHKAVEEEKFIRFYQIASSTAKADAGNSPTQTEETLAKAELSWHQFTVLLTAILLFSLSFSLIAMLITVSLQDACFLQLELTAIHCQPYFPGAERGLEAAPKP